MKTKIGIIICDIKNNKQYVTDTYIQAIHKAQGLPLILPQVRSKHSIQDFVNLCDGFLFCGGGDITPLLFQETPSFGIGDTNYSLDIFQLRLMKCVLTSRKPLLAICRGMQILNVALGGTLYQDLSLVDDSINHVQKSYSKKDISHKVTFTPKSKMYRLFGDFNYTNSFHHQAINKLGNNLNASGRTQDNLIESVELSNHPFTIGVQWHPECMTSDRKMQLLFDFLVHHSSNK